MIHFAVRSYYSLLESTLSISDIVTLAKQNGQTAVCLCDHNVLYGSMAFYHACKRNGLKPILGLDADVMYQDEICRFYLIARNLAGYRKLVAFSTSLNTQKKALDIEDPAGQRLGHGSPQKDCSVRVMKSSCTGLGSVTK